MSRPANIIDIFTHGAAAGGGYGGWSYVVREGEEWRGAAGGATRTDPEAMALTGLLAALDSLAAAPKGAQLALHLVDPLLLAGSELHPELSRRLDKIGADRPGKLKLIAARKTAKAADWAVFVTRPRPAASFPRRSPSSILRSWFKTPFERCQAARKPRRRHGGRTCLKR